MTNIPMYGQSGDGSRLEHIINMLFPDHYGAAAKGFFMKTGSVSFAGGGGIASHGIVVYAGGLDAQVWGGYVKVSGLTAVDGSLDFDLGLTASASDFGTGYGLLGNGVYALKEDEWIDVSGEDVFLSTDVNSGTTADTIVVEVGILLRGAVPESS